MHGFWVNGITTAATLQGPRRMWEKTGPHSTYHIRKPRRPEDLVTSIHNA